MSMGPVSISPRSALATSAGNNKQTFGEAKIKSSEPWWDETFVGDRYYPRVYADELLTPLPGVPFLAYKHVE